MDYTCKGKFPKDYNRLLCPKYLSYNLRYLTPESSSGVSLCSRLMPFFPFVFFSPKFRSLFTSGSNNKKRRTIYRNFYSISSALFYFALAHFINI